MTPFLIFISGRTTVIGVVETGFWDTETLPTSASRIIGTWNGSSVMKLYEMQRYEWLVWFLILVDWFIIYWTNSSTFLYWEVLRLGWAVWPVGLLLLSHLKECSTKSPIGINKG